MCLIIENKTNKNLLSLVNKEFLNKVVKKNPDGFGITFTNNNQIKTIKGFGLDLFLDQINEVEKKSKNYYIHFRQATVGKVCLENIHPFDVLNNEELYLMHNGTLPEIKENKKNLSCVSSDTKILSDFIKGLIKNKENVTKIHEFKALIETKLGVGRAVLISKSESILFNESLWVLKENGLRFSKEFA